MKNNTNGMGKVAKINSASFTSKKVEKYAVAPVKLLNEEVIIISKIIIIHVNLLKIYWNNIKRMYKRIGIYYVNNVNYIVKILFI